MCFAYAVAGRREEEGSRDVLYCAAWVVCYVMICQQKAEHFFLCVCFFLVLIKQSKAALLLFCF